MAEDVKFEEWKAQNEAKLEHYRAVCQYDLEHYRVGCQYDLEQNRVVNSAGQSALKANMFLNAGATVAILAFLANNFNEFDPFIALKIILSICFFSGGALLGAIATGFTYLCQFAYGNKKTTTGNVLNMTSNIMVMVAYNLFVIGGYLTFWGVTHKFNMTFSPCHHWIFGIILAVVDIVILCVVIWVLKTNDMNNREKQGDS